MGKRLSKIDDTSERKGNSEAGGIETDLTPGRKNPVESLPRQGGTRAKPEVQSSALEEGTNTQLRLKDSRFAIAASSGQFDPENSVAEKRKKPRKTPRGKNGKNRGKNLAGKTEKTSEENRGKTHKKNHGKHLARGYDKSAEFPPFGIPAPRKNPDKDMRSSPPLEFPPFGIPAPRKNPDKDMRSSPPLESEPQAYRQSLSHPDKSSLGSGLPAHAKPATPFPPLTSAKKNVEFQVYQGFQDSPEDSTPKSPPFAGVSSSDELPRTHRELRKSSRQDINEKGPAKAACESQSPPFPPPRAEIRPETDSQASTITPPKAAWISSIVPFVKLESSTTPPSSPFPSHPTPTSNYRPASPFPAERGGENTPPSSPFPFPPTSHYRPASPFPAEQGGENNSDSGLSFALTPADKQGVSLQESTTASSFGYLSSPVPLADTLFALQQFFRSWIAQDSPDKEILSVLLQQINMLLGREPSINSSIVCSAMDAVLLCLKSKPTLYYRVPSALRMQIISAGSNTHAASETKTQHKNLFPIAVLSECSGQSIDTKTGFPPPPCVGLNSVRSEPRKLKTDVALAYNPWGKISAKSPTTDQNSGTHGPRTTLPGSAKWTRSVPTIPGTPLTSFPPSGSPPFDSVRDSHAGLDMEELISHETKKETICFLPPVTPIPRIAPLTCDKGQKRSHVPASASPLSSREISDISPDTSCITTRPGSRTPVPDLQIRPIRDKRVCRAPRVIDAASTLSPNLESAPAPSEVSPSRDGIVSPSIPAQSFARPKKTNVVCISGPAKHKKESSALPAVRPSADRSAPSRDSVVSLRTPAAPSRDGPGSPLSPFASSDFSKKGTISSGLAKLPKTGKRPSFEPSPMGHTDPKTNEGKEEPATRPSRKILELSASFSKDMDYYNLLDSPLDSEFSKTYKVQYTPKTTGVDPPESGHPACSVAPTPLNEQNSVPPAPSASNPAFGNQIRAGPAPSFVNSPVMKYDSCMSMYMLTATGVKDGIVGEKPGSVPRVSPVSSFDTQKAPRSPTYEEKLWKKFRNDPLELYDAPFEIPQGTTTISVGGSNTPTYIRKDRNPFHSPLTGLENPEPVSPNPHSAVLEGEGGESQQLRRRLRHCRMVAQEALSDATSSEEKNYALRQRVTLLTDQVSKGEHALAASQAEERKVRLERDALASSLRQTQQLHREFQEQEARGRQAVSILQTQAKALLSRMLVLTDETQQMATAISEHQILAQSLPALSPSIEPLVSDLKTESNPPESAWLKDFRERLKTKNMDFVPPPRNSPSKPLELPQDTSKAVPLPPSASPFPQDTSKAVPPPPSAPPPEPVLSQPPKAVTPVGAWSTVPGPAPSVAFRPLSSSSSEVSEGPLCPMTPEGSEEGSPPEALSIESETSLAPGSPSVESLESLSVFAVRAKKHPSTPVSPPTTGDTICPGCSEKGHSVNQCPYQFRWCPVCQRLGHKKIHCCVMERRRETRDLELFTDTRTPPLDSYQRVCLGCQGKGHSKRQCPFKDFSCDECYQTGHPRARCAAVYDFRHRLEVQAGLDNPPRKLHWQWVAAGWKRKSHYTKTPLPAPKRSTNDTKLDGDRDLLEEIPSEIPANKVRSPGKSRSAKKRRNTEERKSRGREKESSLRALLCRTKPKRQLSDSERPEPEDSVNPQSDLADLPSEQDLADELEFLSQQDPTVPIRESDFEEWLSRKYPRDTSPPSSPLPSEPSLSDPERPESENSSDPQSDLADQSEADCEPEESGNEDETETGSESEYSEEEETREDCSPDSERRTSPNHSFSSGEEGQAYQITLAPSVPPSPSADPPETLSPAGLASYFAGLKNAHSLKTMSALEHQTFLETAVVNGIPIRPIPQAPREMPLVTQEIQVAGHLQMVTLDCAASISLIPRRVLLALVEAKGQDYFVGRVSPARTRIRGISHRSFSTAQAVLLRFDLGNISAEIPCLVDERVERESSPKLPLILGTNGLSALGFTLISPTGKILMGPLFHQLGWKIVDNSGEILYRGQPLPDLQPLHSIFVCGTDHTVGGDVTESGTQPKNTTTVASAGAPSQTLAAPGSGSRPSHPPYRPKNLKNFPRLDLGDRALSPLKLDRWVSSLRFLMADECPGLGPQEQARMLVHNTVQSDNSHGQRLRDYVQGHAPSLEETVAWIKSKILPPVDTFERERAALGISWQQDQETLTEYKDRLVFLMQEAAQTTDLPASELARTADRYFLGLPRECRLYIVDKNTPRELEALHTAAARWNDQQRYLEFSDRHEEIRKTQHPPEEPRESLETSSEVYLQHSRESVYRFPRPSEFTNKEEKPPPACQEEHWQRSLAQSDLPQSGRDPDPPPSFEAQEFSRMPSVENACRLCWESNHCTSHCPFADFNCHACGLKGHQRKHCNQVKLARAARRTLDEKQSTRRPGSRPPPKTPRDRDSEFRGQLHF